MNKILVLPSIDIKDGKTVRVVQGIPDLNCKEYGNDPVEMAMIWRAENTKVIHVVDFDSSHHHSHKNYDILGEICESVIIPIEYGGGIHSLEEADEIFDLGAFRLVIGSLAVSDPDEYKKILEKYGPTKISASIDVVNDEVVTHGRKNKTGMSAVEFAIKLTDFGINRFVVTDVLRNGMLEGPNIELCTKIANVSKGKVTLSGGISNYKDLISLQECSTCGIDSVIIGRALYENKFACQKIWRVAEAGIFD
ncbi:MAG: 1-(5-phosphoribosyl)-5-[(5-phosphoribosylamino)methylideneamino] imidazole-4-carboxamide isomerase [Ignavibacteriae bacterium]|nr:1-(5-phosphoribosyl)-5-[(5-phosphoribosylamino)methylideneamino] imidazole-4-carboxamide isomerase [Ignavibacteriota bacterium]